MGSNYPLVARTMEGRKVIEVDHLLTYLDKCNELAFWRDGQATLAAIKQKIETAAVEGAGTTREI